MVLSVWLVIHHIHVPASLATKDSFVKQVGRPIYYVFIKVALLTNSIVTTIDEFDVVYFHIVSCHQ